MLHAPDEEEEEELRQEDPAEFFYLWDTKLHIFELFCTVSNYLTETMTLNPTLIITLCELRKIDLEEALADLPVILDGFMSVMYPPKSASSNQRKEQPDGR